MSNIGSSVPFADSEQKSLIREAKKAMKIIERV
jgi:hypothetical protein